MQTSLNMPGFSITLLLLPRSGMKAAPAEALILSLLDDKPDVPGWKWSSTKAPSSSVGHEAKAPVTQVAETGSVQSRASHTKIAAADSQGFVQAIIRACEALCKAEPEITQMDTIAGDGDCGLTLKAGAEGGRTDVLMLDRCVA